MFDNSDKKQTFKIAITGHRTLLNQEEVKQQIAHFFEHTKQHHKHIEAISALAAGADTIFIEEAIKQKIAVRFVLPFALEEYKKDFEAEAMKVLEDLIKNNKNQYEICSTLQTDSQNERNEAYLILGKKIVDECDLLLAVWDEKPAKGKGGTGDIVEYARKEGKEIKIIKAIR